MAIEQVKDILDEVLQLDGRAASFVEETALLGAIPEFDSMSVVTIITRIEEDFGVELEDDEIDAEIFETLGALTDFVESKL